MTEREWFTVVDPKWMLEWVAPRMSERKLRLFAVACCRHVAHPCRATFEQILARVEEAAEEPAGVRRRGWRWPSVAAMWMSRAESDLAHALSAGPAAQAARAASEQAAALAKRNGDGWVGERWFQTGCLCDVAGNPFRPVAFSPAWRTDTVEQLARGMYESRDFSAVPILADALQDAGGDDEEMLAHGRDPHQPHVRGCWVVDLVLGKA